MDGQPLVVIYKQSNASVKANGVVSQSWRSLLRTRSLIARVSPGDVSSLHLFDKSSRSDNANHVSYVKHAITIFGHDVSSQPNLTELLILSKGKRKRIFFEIMQFNIILATIISYLGEIHGIHTKTFK